MRMHTRAISTRQESPSYSASAEDFITNSMLAMHCRKDPSVVSRWLGPMELLEEQMSELVKRVAEELAPCMVGNEAAGRRCSCR